MLACFDEVAKIASWPFRDERKRKGTHAPADARA